MAFSGHRARTAVSAIALAASLTACSGDAPKPARAIPSDSPIDIAWKVSIRGIGQVQSGMNAAEVKKLLPDLKAPDNLETAGCTYARSETLPAGVTIMFANGHVARINVASGAARTIEGAGIGDSEMRIDSIYGNRVHSSRAKYTAGHYLTVWPASTADSNSRIVFESEASKVSRFRSGALPAVEYVEGCG